MTTLKPKTRPRLSWKRLSIRVKLLIPIFLAFAVALVVLVWRVPPPINALVEGNIRGVFSTRLSELRTPLIQFLDAGQKDLQGLAVNNPDLDGFLTAQRSDDKASQTAEQSALASAFVGKITDGQLPYDSLRFVTIDGKQVALATARLIGEAISGQITSTKNLAVENLSSYQDALGQLADGRGYVLPPRLSSPDKKSGLQPEPLVEIAYPVYFQSKLAGVVIGSFRARTLLVDTFRQTSGNRTYASVLADQSGRIIAYTNPAVLSGVSVLGDDSTIASEANLPLKSLDGTSQVLQTVQGQVYLPLTVSKQNSLPDNRWLLLVSDGVNVVYADAISLEGTLFLLFGLVFVIAIIGIGAVSQSVILPLIEVSRVADRVAAGDLEAQVPMTSEDEVGMVASALNTMSSRLLDLIRNLEARVQERTRNIEIAAEISRDTTQLSSLKDLLQHTVDVVQERFGLYYVQIFLSDEENKYAVLTVGSGEVAAKLLAADHRLEIGSQSVVGQSVAKGEAVIISDTEATGAAHRFNPLLPLTRAEMASPLRIGDKTVGVLDLQSIEVHAFDGENAEVFQMMADQIAIAVTNARLFDQSEEARRIADDANRQKSEFLSNMSHELRTPLNVIIGYSHSIVNRPAMYENVPLPIAYQPAVQSIMVSGQHLLGLINDILDLSKIEAGRIELDAQPMNIWPILEGLRSTTLGLLKPDVKLRADYVADLPLIMADELRYRQILLNLISNAAKFTDQGFITLDAKVADGRLVVSVADTGSGIPDKAKTLIFERFRQASSDVVKRMGGSGLGLNISRQLTHMQGGEIWFESEQGKGSIFYVAIPLAPLSADGRAGDSLRPTLMRPVIRNSQAHIFLADETADQTTMRQVLLIDTSSESRAGVEAALSRAQFSVLSTDNHERALTIATTLLPDAVLIMLHPDDGEAMRGLFAQLRKDENLTHTPTIVLDAHVLAIEKPADLYQLALEQVQARFPASVAS